MSGAGAAGGAVGLGGPRVGVATCDEAVGREIYGDVSAVRALLREAMVQGGLGRADPARPLADLVRPGATVLLKPNWVLHLNHSGGSMDCMVTHPAFVRAAIAEVAAGGAGRIMVADAPVQSADFDALTPPGWRAQAAEAAGGVPLEILDLRDVVATRRGGVLHHSRGRRDPSRFVLFDLGRDSLLEPVSGDGRRFRITSYDPARLARVQRPGVHQFLLCREPFEADLVLNLPKLKAHAKAGLTAALKNLVGVNGDKNYLPHHRVGGSAWGGDCYQGLKPFKRLAEWMLDRANARIGRPGYAAWSGAASACRRLHAGDVEGKWHGNDTTWRMVLDLNRLLIHGRLDGTLAAEPQRRVYSLTDALVAGQRNGPLAPDDAWLGAVTFADSSAFADLVHAGLMRFDWRLVPLVREAFGCWPYRITAHAPADLDVRHRGQRLGLDEVAARLGRPLRAPDGWAGHVELPR